MKHLTATLFIGLLMMCTAIAQKRSAPLLVKGLNIKFKVITNSYQNKPQSRSLMLLSVANYWKLPKAGWKIYFSFARQIIPTSVTGDIQIKHINGDFFCISPLPGFKGIAAGKSSEINFTSSDWIINQTDQPDGFYLVWDTHPDKAYHIDQVKMLRFGKSEQYMRSQTDQVDTVTARSVFAQNQSIRDIPVDSLVKIFPTPVFYKETGGEFILDDNIRIVSAPVFLSEKNYVFQTLKGMLPMRKNNADKGKTISLVQKPMGDEAYELIVKRDGITIAAATPAGVFYGIQSLKTLISPASYQRKRQSIVIKNVVVKDEPRFGYRALMLDVARNFQSKHQILKLLDVMSLYKLNVLHFHLTDDEGWRLEIDGLPQLTQVGGKRGHQFASGKYLQPGLGSGPDVRNVSGSGYYTKRDFIEILKYATQRHIWVIPEIESPGHARAAIKAMDARYAYYKALGKTEEAERYLLHDKNDTSKYTSVQYYNDNVVDVAMPSTYRFVDAVTADIVKMYQEARAPLQTIHLGGDEVPVGVWLGSPAFQKLMRADTSIKSADDLWFYYYERVSKILASRKLYLTAWEETGLVKATVNNQKINILNKGLLNHNVHLEVWNNVLGWGAEDLAYKQANAGYKVILSCVSNLYLDMAYEKSFDEPGYYWGGYIDMDKFFKFIPYNYFKNTTEDRMGKPLNKSYLQAKEQLTPTGKANIIGLQGALWGETLKSGQRMEYMLLPKLLGLAERAWSAEPEWAVVADSTRSSALYTESWSRFVNILGKLELPRLDHYASGFSYRIPQAGAVLQNNTIIVNSQLPGFKVRYTADGSIPNKHSAVYTKPIALQPKQIIKLSLFNQAGRSGRVFALGRF
jgi:hexosaminidase